MKVTEQNLQYIFPEGTLVGLDPSRNSTGLVIVKNRVVESRQLAPEQEFPEDALKDAQQKEELKTQLAKALEGMEIDLMVVETIFFGGFVNSLMKLAVIMNITEELILEGRLNVKRLVRVQSTQWKSWLRPYRREGKKELQGNQGKEIVNDCLDNLGLLELVEAGEGWQDRVDALGMLTGFLLNEKENSGVKLESKDVRVRVVGEETWRALLKGGAVVAPRKSRFTSRTVVTLLENAGGGTVVSPGEVSLGFEALHIRNLERESGMDGTGYVVIELKDPEKSMRKGYKEWNREEK